MESCYRSEDVSKFDQTEQNAHQLIQKYFDDHDAVFEKGELTQREKALIALAVAHAVQCPYCMDAFTQSCLEKGSNIKEMTEAMHVATTIRGGAALVKRMQIRRQSEEVYVY